MIVISHMKYVVLKMIDIVAKLIMVHFWFSNRKWINKPNKPYSKIDGSILIKLLYCLSTSIGRWQFPILKREKDDILEVPLPVVDVITIGAYIRTLTLFVPIQYATTVASIEYGTFPFREYNSRFMCTWYMYNTRNLMWPDFVP